MTIRPILRAFAFGAPAAVAFFAAGAAQAQPFDVQQFHPGPSLRTSFFDLPAPEILGHKMWEAGLMLDYARSPLVVDPPTGDIQDIVGGQLTSAFSFALGIKDRLQLGLVLPLILAQPGDDIPALGDANAPDPGFGVGDVRVAAAVQILSPDDDGGVGLGIELPVWLPTGDVESYQGDGSARFEPRIVAGYTLASGIRFGGSLGYHIRRVAIVENVDVDDTLTFGVGGGVPVGPVELIAELTGESRFGVDNTTGEEVPLATNFGVRHEADSGIMVQGGMGVGLNEGFGTPRYRLFVGVSYGGEEREALPPPPAPEPLSLPPPPPPAPSDRDGDGILDNADSCPDEPEDVDNFQDNDGCPDNDNDGDSVLDAADRCPNDAEDADGFEDTDGCPDPDNDGDGFVDASDTCPVEPEDFDGFEDTDGCPDEGSGLVSLRCDRIEIAESVFFDTNSDVIQERSHGLLDQIAGVLRAASYVRVVSIDGHTDNRGGEDLNIDLSNRRAASVMRYLTNAGIEASRLRSEGFGPARPIADNATAEGRAQNRRVEFRIVETDSACADAAAPAAATEAPAATPPATEAPAATPPATEAPAATPPATDAPAAAPPATDAPAAP